MLRREGMESTVSQLRRRERNPLPGLWDKNDFAARIAWNSVKTLTKADQGRMKALADRQSALALTVPPDSLLHLDALATAPFTTGLGNEHPLENGFAFLNPYGLPYLPGSGVKGVLRQAARELASGDWGDACGWSEEKAFTLRAGKEHIRLSTLDALFGLESGDGDTNHVRGALAFWDVIPQIKGDSLMVEIMTPHQGHYYQWKKDQRGNPIEVAPHDSGSPVPISYLTVPPGSGFTFFVTCDAAHLARLAPDLAQADPTSGEPRWKTMLTAAFEHAFAWLGFGAKTAVGYGAMQRDRGAEEAAAKKAAEEAERAAREDAQRCQREVEAAEAARREAEFAALPESEKAFRQLDKDLAPFDGSGSLNADRYAELAGVLNRFAEQAKAWRDPSARDQAGDRLQTAFDRFGWAGPGLKRDKREKQERKRREMIKAVRGDSAGGPP